MSWEKWVLIAWLVIGVLYIISKIGQPRKPITPNEAVWTIIINAVFVVLLVLA